MDYDLVTGEQATFRGYIMRQRGSRDEVVIHTYLQPEPDADREHEVWRFWLIDEEDREVKYKTTRGKSEPSELALLAVQEYGWDCLNFSRKDDEEYADSEAESYGRLAEQFLKGSLMADDPARRELLEELFVAAELYAALTDPSGGGSDILRMVYDEADADVDAALDLEVPSYVPLEKQVELSDALVARFSALMDEYSDVDYAFEDERTLTRDDNE